MPSRPRNVVASVVVLSMLATGCFASRGTEPDAAATDARVPVDGGAEPVDAPADAAPLDARAGDCTSNADCDDGVFCNGVEECTISWPRRRCVPATLGPCHVACDEDGDRCCPDEDGDLHAALGCSTGDDCDDHEYYVNPGAGDACGGADQDCDPSTLGWDGDADRDGARTRRLLPGGRRRDRVRRRLRRRGSLAAPGRGGALRRARPGL